MGGQESPSRFLKHRSLCRVIGLTYAPATAGLAQSEWWIWGHSEEVARRRVIADMHLMRGTIAGQRPEGRDGIRRYHQLIQLPELREGYEC